MNRGSNANRVPRDHYQEVTDRIIAALEAGTPPWRKPWVSRDNLGENPRRSG